MTTAAPRFEVTQDAENSFGIHDLSQSPPERVAEVHSETHANLFAAAPDMVAALKLAAVGLETASRNITLSRLGNDLPAELRRRAALCRTAIAKAKGQADG